MTSCGVAVIPPRIRTSASQVVLPVGVQLPPLPSLPGYDCVIGSLTAWTKSATLASVLAVPSAFLRPWVVLLTRPVCAERPSSRGPAVTRRPASVLTRVVKVTAPSA